MKCYLVKTNCYFDKAKYYFNKTKYYFVKTNCYVFITNCYFDKMKYYFDKTKYYFIKTNCYFDKMKYYFNIRRLYMDNLSSQCHLDLWPTEWNFRIAFCVCTEQKFRLYRYFYATRIDRSGAYCLWSVRLSVWFSAKSFTLTIAFEW